MSNNNIIAKPAMNNDKFATFADEGYFTLAELDSMPGVSSKVIELIVNSNMDNDSMVDYYEVYINYDMPENFVIHLDHNYDLVPIVKSVEFTGQSLAEYCKRYVEDYPEKLSYLFWRDTNKIEYDFTEDSTECIYERLEACDYGFYARAYASAALAMVYESLNIRLNSICFYDSYYNYVYEGLYSDTNSYFDIEGRPYLC